MPATSSKTKGKTASAKPYDRKAAVAGAKAETNIGAPAQLSQKSRKGKKAWRKNVDIRGEEAALEQAREEERVTGGPVAQKKDSDLFVVDTVGDVAVAQKLRRAPKPLRSLAVLNERSAVPSLTSRATPSTTSRKTKISAAEKARLRRIARRDTIASDGTGKGSAEVKAPTVASADAWAEEKVSKPTGGYAEETLVKKQIKAPKTIARQREIYLSSQVAAGRAVELPDQGTSYNPAAEAHARLIELAVEEEKAQVQKEKEQAERIATLGEVVNARRQAIPGDEYAPGMVVGPGEVDSDEDDESDSAGPSRVVKPTKRKTQAQRNKKARQKELARLENIEKTQRRLAKSIGSISNVKQSLEAEAKRLAEAERLAKLAKKERERLGLTGGEKVGRHRVPKSKVTVQLGEDLAESLRQVKPEGNLFKDRFLALQKKSLLEPRVPQLPKRKNRVKEYEKHAYKKFV